MAVEFIAACKRNILRKEALSSLQVVIYRCGFGKRSGKNDLIEVNTRLDYDQIDQAYQLAED